MRNIQAKRIVVKIGTNTICREDGTVDQTFLNGVAKQIIDLGQRGIETIIVTSGAIGSGAAELGLANRPRAMAEKQACAAVGQATLMMAWRDAFRRYGKSVGQVLLTYGAISSRERYLHLLEAIEAMFALGTVPIVNENDVLATDEIEEIFGDNDRLSAMVASKMDAHLLILLTDVDGLYDHNPDLDPDARLIRTVDGITKDIERIAGGTVSERSVGGMKTKIAAAKIAMASGTDMVIAPGREPDVIQRILSGEELGTLFTAERRYTNRQRFILFAGPKGKILVDAGAEKALRKGKSLLPCGITSVEGRFKKGDVVRIGNFAKGVSNFSSEQLPSLIESNCRYRAEGKGKVGNDQVVVSNDKIVLLHQAD